MSWSACNTFHWVKEIKISALLLIFLYFFPSIGFCAAITCHILVSLKPCIAASLLPAAGLDYRLQYHAGQEALQLAEDATEALRCFFGAVTLCLNRCSHLPGWKTNWIFPLGAGPYCTPTEQQPSLIVLLQNNAHLQALFCSEGCLLHTVQPAGAGWASSDWTPTEVNIH